MLNTVADVLSVVLGALALIALGVWARARETVDLLGKHNDALEDRVADLEEQVKNADEVLDASAARNMALELRNRELLDLVTARPELEQLRRELGAYSDRVHADHTQVLRMLDRILLATGVPLAQKSEREAEG